MSTWPTSESPNVRWRMAAALAVSLACHGLVALAAGRGAAITFRSMPPIVVTMLEAGKRGGPADGVPLDDPSAPTTAAVAAAPAESVPPRPRPARAAQQPRAPRPVAAPAPRTALAVAPPATGTVASTRGTEDSEGSARPAGDAAGAGPGGRGSGSMGDGTGGDGLRAFCRSCPAPDYPARARRQGWQGTVDVALQIDPDGSVVAAAVEHTSGFGALDDVALTTARASRFAVPDGGQGLRGQLRYRFVLDAGADRR